MIVIPGRRAAARRESMTIASAVWHGSAAAIMSVFMDSGLATSSRPGMTHGGPSS
jgi:hypothetical protein